MKPVQCPLSVTMMFEPDDTAALREIIRAGGFTSEQAAIRCALYHLGQHLGLRLPSPAFSEYRTPKERKARARRLTRPTAT